MIHTTIKNCNRYLGLNPNFQQAFALLNKMQNEPFCVGKKVYEGHNLYSISLSYETKAIEDVVFEAHRKFIDVMLIVEGQETIGYLPSQQVGKVTKLYDDSIDALLASTEPGMSKVNMVAGDIAIFYPEDYHAPGANYDGIHSVKKIIMKVPV